MIDRRTLPLEQLKQMSAVYTQVRDIIKENNDVFQIIHQDELSMEIIDTSRNSKFRFKLDNPKYENNKTIYRVTHNPSSSASIKDRNSSVPSESIEKFLNRWISYIRAYNDVKLIPDDDILYEYEQEFYENFEILDEDADIKPYELEKQIIIYNFISASIAILERNPSNNDDLIIEAVEIRDNLQHWTKRKTVRKISKFFAKTRKKSLTILKEILIEGKKELYKRAINGGFDFITDLITGM